MLSLDHHDYPAWIEFFHQGIGDLTGEPLLDLRSLGVQIDQSRDL
ncbi:Uncharacterised protein [Mycobacterium tuberculosis]|uniref:Uncharacterized protein n=1 Tax=Mycobacterium tuberculosis TaxID=1773 RepID=A0A655FGH7_MYCTX|nr:Uncharacterised protein [Mycobacterium tuberculosis]CKR72115.1 Uncharacterised protein [Mycobacterium tuberculosis]CKT62518.1 Uncharacterised protein [Mycobacterium tuberculosis]CNV71357.1 Uncharacterised protein [Mycobacterium tuberculosis]CPA77546.1 Uncharacterised protein [Mycobacterium tuberculosis]